MSSSARNNVASPEVDVAVVGAGIAGLVAARELAQQGLSVVVLEKDDHTGGRIQTERGPNGYFEHGGILHTHGYHATRRLIDEVGLTGKVAAVPTAFHSAVRVGTGWEHVDYGALTGPLRTDVLGWPDRLSLLRAAVPALLARPKDLGDLTSLARFDTKPATSGLTARAGTYFTAGPHEFLWGVPSSDVSYAMLAMQLHVFTGELREITGGTGQLVERIARDTEVRHGCAVERVEARDDDVVLHLSRDGRPVRARGVVLACPADVAAKLWPVPPRHVFSEFGVIQGFCITE